MEWTYPLIGMIVGHGIDIASIPRIERSLERFAERFLQRCFTRREQDYAQGRRRPATHLAGRFAAKEAVLKALGTGWRSGIAWTDIEILSMPTGEPALTLHGMAARIAEERGATRWWISISHTGDHAIASAIATSD